MIPKVIHYCWFGNNEKPKVVLECIESWKKYLPDYKIIEWNEHNYDVGKNQYLKDAYAEKKWAFVSDFARMDILYKYGGIYLDVDVEFLKPLPDEVLQLPAFCGFECTGIVAPGLIFAVEKNNQFVKRIIDSFADDRFASQKKGVYKTINLRITDALVESGLQKNNQLQTICDITVFPSEYFCGYDTDVREPNITDKTICWHHYLGSWSNPSFKMYFQDSLKRIIGVTNYRKLLMFIRKIRVLRNK